MTSLEKKEYMKIYYQNNKDKFKDYYQNNKENIKDYYQNNKENIKDYRKEYFLKNKENIKEYHKEYWLENKDRLKENNKEYDKKRRKIDYLYKLTHNIRVLIRESIKKQGYSKKSKSCQILGCTFEEFEQHLERQFKKGMTWENQGKWHLDHIYPVSLAKDEKELIKLNHYANFQPMWAAENISKGNRIIANTQIKLI